MTICAQCKFFTVKDHPQQAAAGMGHCIGFLASIMNFVPWDNESCGIYREAREKAAREKFIQIQKAKNEKEA